MGIFLYVLKNSNTLLTVSSEQILVALLGFIIMTVAVLLALEVLIETSNKYLLLTLPIGDIFCTIQPVG